MGCMCDGEPPQEFRELYRQEYHMGKFNLYAIYLLCDSVFAEVSRMLVFEFYPLCVTPFF